MAKRFPIRDKGFTASGFNMHTGQEILTPDRCPYRDVQMEEDGLDV